MPEEIIEIESVAEPIKEIAKIFGYFYLNDKISEEALVSAMPDQEYCDVVTRYVQFKRIQDFEQKSLAVAQKSAQPDKYRMFRWS
jgi:hypothetical protein